MTCGIFSFRMWDLFPGVKLEPPALGVQSLSPWAARKSPGTYSIVATFLLLPPKKHTQSSVTLGL